MMVRRGFFLVNDHRGEANDERVPHRYKGEQFICYRQRHGAEVASLSELEHGILIRDIYYAKSIAREIILCLGNTSFDMRRRWSCDWYCHSRRHQHLVYPVKSTLVDSTELAIWTGVDGALRNDGDQYVVSLENGHRGRQEHPSCGHFIRCAIGF